uniref:Uncharacterized protein n=1 Tax=Pseudictyota dubia TaxID=2749911 RepID=A0A7R9VIJ1_9STRA
MALKKLASDYSHPEKPVEIDPAAFGRNYFGPQEEFEDAEERAASLADALALKKLAIDYAHPEARVTTTDSTAFGRNYFTRPSAPAHEDAEEAEKALADAQALAKLAKDYAHPEVGVGTTEATATARCYYSRHSSPTHNDLLVTARSAAKPEARVSAVGPLPPSATERQQGGKKAAEKKKGGNDDDIPRVSSSHMLFGMAE